MIPCGVLRRFGSWELERRGVSSAATGSREAWTARPSQPACARQRRPAGWPRWWTLWSRGPRTSAARRPTRRPYPCFQVFRRSLFYSRSRESLERWATAKCGLMRRGSLVGLGPAESKCYVSDPAEARGRDWSCHWSCCCSCLNIRRYIKQSKAWLCFSGLSASSLLRGIPSRRVSVMICRLGRGGRTIRTTYRVVHEQHVWCCVDPDWDETNQ